MNLSLVGKKTLFVIDFIVIPEYPHVRLEVSIDQLG